MISKVAHGLVHGPKPLVVTDVVADQVGITHGDVLSLHHLLREKPLGGGSEEKRETDLLRLPQEAAGTAESATDWSMPTPDCNLQ